jgi:hypothetical protein
MFYFFGILIGILAVICLQRRLLINVCNMLNLSLALLALGFTIYLAGFQNGVSGESIAFLYGTSYSVGLVNIYYLTGLMIKKL